MTSIAFYKPYGVLTKFTDAEGRPTLAAFIDLPGVYPAGRLDMDSEGLLILTDDGPLAARITSPQHKLPKLYYAQVERIPEPPALAALRRGVLIKGRRTRPAGADLLPGEPDLPARDPPIRWRKDIPTAWLALTLFEGQNRQVRRMTAAVGHPTLRLVRVQIGPVALGALHPGAWRPLTADEIKALRAARR